ncbi:MAG: glycosyltransferase [Phycisphaerales bacterium]|nr:glycosyltransferase [Phycisphaerales bacterium]
MVHTSDLTCAATVDMTDAASVAIGLPPRPADPLDPLPDEPLVSIVIPCRNPGRRLDTALRSIAAQTYAHIEHIVVDAASTDGTVDRLRTMRRPGYHWISEPDDGQTDAIRKGFAQARGHILTWLNADDVLLPHAARTWVELLHHESRPALAYGGCFEWFEQVGWMVPAPWVRPPDYHILRDRTDFIMQPAAAFRADALHTIGGLDRELHYAMDWDLWLSLSERWPVAYDHNVLAANRVHADTKTATGGAARILEIRRIGRRHGRSHLAPANHRYGLVALSERSAAVAWLRGAYKRARTRLSPTAESSALARACVSQITALPLTQPRTLWVINPSDADRLIVHLQGDVQNGYTVSVDGEPAALIGVAGRHIAQVPRTASICRRVDLPASPGVALLGMTLSTDAERPS